MSKIGIDLSLARLNYKILLLNWKIKSVIARSNVIDKN